MPFLVIILVLVVRGRGLPLRGSITDRLPRVGTGRVRPLVVLVLVALAVVWLLTSSASCTDAGCTNTQRYVATIISVTFAIVGLSVVVLTGYTGQLSLAQFALAGIGAFTAGKLTAAHGWRFEPALLVGVLVAMAIGFVFGLPALRTRGVNLAVVTFGLGFAVFQLVFSNSSYTENARVQPSDITFLGLPVDPVGHPRNYAFLCLGFLVLAALAVANLRRGRIGRRLLAVRTNERAAAAIGVNVFEAKLYAFTLSAGIAGLGGVLRRLLQLGDPLPGGLPARRLDQRAGADRDRQRRLPGRPDGGVAAGLRRAGHPHLVERAGERRRRRQLELAAVPADRHRRPAARRADPQPERRRRAGRRPDPRLPVADPRAAAARARAAARPRSGPPSPRAPSRCPA